MIQQFLHALDPEAESFLFVAVNPPRVAHSQFVGEYKTEPVVVQKALRVAECEPLLRARNELGFGIYVSVNRNDGSNYRKAKDITHVRALALDRDKPHEVSREALLTQPLPPHAIVQTSPGKHQPWWFVEIGAIPLHHFTPLQKALIARFGGDDISDLPRVLRVPGFNHTKDLANLHPITLAYFEPDRPRYTAEQIYRWLPFLEPEPKPPIKPWNGKAHPNFIRLYRKLYNAGEIERAGDGWFDIVCPINPNHTARLYMPSSQNAGVGGVHCLHAKVEGCVKLNIRDMYKDLAR